MHQQPKAPRARPRRDEALSAALTLAAGSHAYAEVVAFVNEGALDLTLQCPEGHAPSEKCLDLTQPAVGQPLTCAYDVLNGLFRSTMGCDEQCFQYPGSYGCYCYVVCGYYCGDPPYGYCCIGLFDCTAITYQGDVALSTYDTVIPYQGIVDGLLGEGDPIGPAQPFTDVVTWLSFFDEGHFGSFDSSLIADGEVGFFGVGFAIDGQQHFGWVKVQRIGTTLEALAWGYETEPGVPIGAGDGLDQPPRPIACVADVNADGVVGSGDLNLVLPHFGTFVGPVATDLNGNGFVESGDLNIVLGSFGQAVTPGAAGDVNGDGAVGSADLNAVLGAWGMSFGAPGAADLDADGFVGSGDLNLLLAEFGATCIEGG